MWQHLFHDTVQTVYIRLGLFVVRSMQKNTSVPFISTPQSPLPIFSTPVPSINITVPSIGTFILGVF